MIFVICLRKKSLREIPKAFALQIQLYFSAPAFSVSSTRCTAPPGDTIIGFWNTLPGRILGTVRGLRASGGDSVDCDEYQQVLLLARFTLRLNSLPTHGISPSTGTRSSTVITCSRVKPPITSVAPSNTVTDVRTSRTENTAE